jgi:hypothetical protein
VEKLHTKAGLIEGSKYPAWLRLPREIQKTLKTFKVQGLTFRVAIFIFANLPTRKRGRITTLVKSDPAGGDTPGNNYLALLRQTCIARE